MDRKKDDFYYLEKIHKDIDFILLHMKNVGKNQLQEKEKASSVDEAKINSLIEERLQAKKERNYQKADEIRDILTGMGIIIKDTKEGTTWQIG